MIENLLNARTKYSSKYNTARWVSNKEAKIIHKIVKNSRATSIYESGTANGFSTLWLALEGAKVTTYDPKSRPKIWDEEEFSGVKHNIIFKQERFCLGLHSKNLKPNLYFIDGDHSLLGVVQDWLSVLYFLKSGDHVIMHDVVHASGEDKGAVRFWGALADPCNRYINRSNNKFKFTTYDTERGVGHMEVL